MSAVVRIIAQPSPVVVVRGDGGQVIKISGQAAAVVHVLGVGVQGPPGPPGGGGSFDIFGLPLAP
ncbi:MAG: hypothetical protein ABL914_12265 [Novosphingobium sp.]|uniref:hypothetical protein n=1 Tax=Novosphingobium sp. TaxID=1874826 RepID=UPI0032BC4415